MCAAAQEQAKRAATVLVVEDHPAMRSMIRDACAERAGLEVIGEAADGASALEKIRQLEPDVVVLDLMLPGLTGLDVARAVRHEGFNTRCLILTARDDPEALFEAIRADAAGYLDKSTDLTSLVDAVAAVAAGESIITQTQQRRAAAQFGAFLRHTREASRAAAQLSARELEVLVLIKKGLTTRQIATRLDLSARTVESHISTAYRKLQVRSRVQAVSRATELGLLTDPDT